MNVKTNPGTKRERKRERQKRPLDTGPFTNLIRADDARKPLPKQSVYAMCSSTYIIHSAYSKYIRSRLHIYAHTHTAVSSIKKANQPRHYSTSGCGTPDDGSSPVTAAATAAPVIKVIGRISRCSCAARVEITAPRRYISYIHGYMYIYLYVYQSRTRCIESRCAHCRDTHCARMQNVYSRYLAAGF